MWSQIKLFLIFLTHIKLRTVLAILGVLVGTASVVAMVSSGQMATEEAISQFKSLGTDLMSVSLNDADTTQFTQPDELSLEEAVAVKTASPNIQQVAPYSTTYVLTVYQGQSSFTNVIGTTNDLADIIHISILQGRFVSIFDEHEP